MERAAHKLVAIHPAGCLAEPDFVAHRAAENAHSKAWPAMVQRQPGLRDTPQVFIHAAINDGLFSLPERRTTNDWPEINGHSELIQVLGFDNGYARCLVRFQGHGTTAHGSERESWLVVSCLTNNATFLRDSK